MFFVSVKFGKFFIILIYKYTHLFILNFYSDHTIEINTCVFYTACLSRVYIIYL